MQTEQNVFSGFQTMAQQWQEAMFSSWSHLAEQSGSAVLNATTSACQDWTRHCQRQVRSNQAQLADAMEFPRASDVQRLQRQVEHTEGRMAACAQSLDELLGVLRQWATEEPEDPTPVARKVPPARRAALGKKSKTNS